jgi:peptidoglycan/LPS O-acetylase OafA/YrhL
MRKIVPSTRTIFFGFASAFLGFSVYYYIRYTTFALIISNLSQLNAYVTWKPLSIYFAVNSGIMFSLGIIFSRFNISLPKLTISDVKSANKSSLSFQPELSGLRGLSALGVILYHADYLLAGSIVFPFFASGWTGVSLFLMLSMFLLLSSLNKNADLKHYFLRRIKRIWPIYFGLVILAYFLHYISLGILFQYVTFTQYYIQPEGWSVLAAFWTLQLEEAMYFIIPLIHKSQRKIPIAYALIGINFAASLVIFLANLPTLSWLTTNHSIVEPLFRFIGSAGFGQLEWFPLWLASYGFGILAYFRPTLIPRWPVYSVPILLIFFMICYPLGIYGFLGGNSARMLIYFSLLPGFAALIIHPPNFLRYFTVLGEGSYGMYAVQYFFFYSLGEIGYFVAIPAGIILEFVLRPKNILERWKIVYFNKPQIQENKIVVPISD